MLNRVLSFSLFGLADCHQPVPDAGAPIGLFDHDDLLPGPVFHHLWFLKTRAQRGAAGTLIQNKEVEFITMMQIAGKPPPVKTN